MKKRKIKAIRVQCLTTQRCNAVCDHCDKAVGLANFPDIEMTPEALNKYVDEIIRDKAKVQRFSFSGGEPLVNRHLPELLKIVTRIPTLLEVRILTNKLNSTAEKRAALTDQFPDDRFRWIEAPLDDLDNPLSGKNLKTDDKGQKIRYRSRVHVPYWVSPADYGVPSNFENCTVRTFCGRGLDNAGWSMCGQAPIIGRILGIDPYPKEGTVQERVDKPIPEICRHCMYGVHDDDKRSLRKKITEPISPTYKEAFLHPPVRFSV